MVRSFFFFQAEDGIRDDLVTGVQTCALPISCAAWPWCASRDRYRGIRRTSSWLPFLPFAGCDECRPCATRGDVACRPRVDRMLPDLGQLGAAAVGSDGFPVDDHVEQGRPALLEGPGHGSVDVGRLREPAGPGS